MAPIPAQQRPALKSMQGGEEGQIMKTSEGTRVRSRELDWFRPVSQRTDGQIHLHRTGSSTQSGNMMKIWTFTVSSRVTEPFPECGRSIVTETFPLPCLSRSTSFFFYLAAIQIWTLSATPARFIFPDRFFPHKLALCASLGGAPTNVCLSTPFFSPFFFKPLTT